MFVGDKNHYTFLWCGGFVCLFIFQLEIPIFLVKGNTLGAQRQCTEKEIKTKPVFYYFISIPSALSLPYPCHLGVKKLGIWSKLGHLNRPYRDRLFQRTIRPVRGA